MARKVTQQRFEEWVRDEAHVVDVLERIAGGLTLQKASLAVKQPYTCLHAYFHSTPELLARYDSARKSWADRKIDENHEIADGVVPDRDHVAKAKLRIDVNTFAAKAYNRDRFGETLTVKKDVTIGVDAVLLGRAGELLALASEKVVAEVPALPEALDPVAPK